MAQAGYTPISLYYSSTPSAAPTAGNLVNGELAINIADGKLYYKDNLGAVKSISGATATYTRTSFTATASQTTFTVAYTVGFVEVFLNGVLLNGTDYTATNGTSIVLASGAALNDIVEVIAYNIVNIGVANSLAGGIASQIPYQSAAGVTAFIPNGTSGQALVSNGTAAPGFATLGSAGGGTGLTTFTAANRALYSTSASALTAGTLPVAAGGTGATTLTANNVILGNGTSAVQFVAPGTNGNVLTSNGTTWTSAAPAASGGKAADVQTFNASGTWTKPTGYSADSRVLIQVWGAGASGARGVASTYAGGGGGGGYNYAWVNLSALGATETVTIGAGGAARATDGNGNVGGNSSFGSIITAYGGGGGSNTETTTNGGGGGGQLSAGRVSIGGDALVGGAPVIQTIGILDASNQPTAVGGSLIFMQGSPRYGNMNGCGPNSWSFPTFMHGAGGGSANTNSGTVVYRGNNSVWGGGGGGGSNTANGAGGTSNFGGNGGAGSSTGAGTAGTQPAGGGGGTIAAANSGAGGSGRIIITVFDGV